MYTLGNPLIYIHTLTLEDRNGTKKKYYSHTNPDLHTVADNT